MNYVLKVMIVTSHYDLDNTIHYMTSFWGQRNSIILYNKTRTTPNRYSSICVTIVPQLCDNDPSVGRRRIYLWLTVYYIWWKELKALGKRFKSIVKKVYNVINAEGNRREQRYYDDTWQIEWICHKHPSFLKPSPPKGLRPKNEGWQMFFVKT